jgi:hypothetical protein
MIAALRRGPLANPQLAEDEILERVLDGAYRFAGLPDG